MLKIIRKSRKSAASRRALIAVVVIFLVTILYVTRALLSNNVDSNSYGEIGGTDNGLQLVTVGAPGPWGPGTAAIPFGMSLGFFQEEKIELKLIAVQGSAVLLPQIANGTVDFGLVTPDLVVLSASRGEPFPIRFFFNYYTSYVFEFVVEDDSDIAVLEDLRGKSVGVGALSWGNLPVTKAILRDAGIEWQKNIQIVPVGTGPAAWRRLKDGNIDALNLYLSQHELMRLSGISIRRLTLSEPYTALFSNGFATRNELFDNRSKLVAGFGRAVAKSLVACRASPRACAYSYWEFNSSVRPPNVGAQQRWLDQFATLNEVDMRSVLANSTDGLIGSYDEAQWKSLVYALKRSGHIATNTVDTKSLFTNSLVQEINQFSIADAQIRARSVAIGL